MHVPERNTIFAVSKKRKEFNMITLLFLIIAFVLRKRYVASSDLWILKVAYFSANIVFSPIIGIPFYKFITGQFYSGPYSRIYNSDGSCA